LLSAHTRSNNSAVFSCAPAQLRVDLFSPMPRTKNSELSLPHQLAVRLLAGRACGKLAATFIENYARQFDRPEASAHPERRRELEIMLDREVLLAMTARVMNLLEESSSRRLTRAGTRAIKLNPPAFLRDLLAAIALESNWTAGDAMEFRGDLEIYRRLAAVLHSAASRSGASRSRTAPRGPFVDRCAILLDPSMIENATRAAGKLLLQIEALTDKLFEETMQGQKA
jgi:hypothetical protein